MNKIPSQKSSHNNVMPTHRKQQSTTSRKSKQSTPKKNDTLGLLNDLDAQKKDASDDHINMMGSILRKSKQKLKKHIQKKNSKHQKLHAIAPTKSIGKSQQQMDSKPNTKKRKTQNDRNQESKKRKNQKEPETQDMLYEDDLMQEDEDDESPYQPFDYNSDESDIIDDLEEDSIKKNHSDAVFVTKEMLDDIRKDEEDPDDKIIATLEKKLKMNKNKKSLDEIDLDPSKPSELDQYVNEKRMNKKKSLKENSKQQDEDDNEDGEEIVPGYVEPEIDEEDLQGFNQNDKMFDSILGNIDPEDLIDLDAEIDAMIESEQNGMSYSDFLQTEIPSLASKMRNVNPQSESEENEDGEEAEENSEEETTTATKYIPPHLRKKQVLEGGKKSESYLALQKNIRNLLNKLSLANLAPLTKESLSLYNSSSKHEFHEIITNTIIESVCDTVDLKSQFILVYAAFIIALHNIGDVSIGAYFIEKLIQKFDSIMTERHQASNLLTLICHVYNLGLIYCGLIYDIIRMLCLNISELNVEFLFKLLQTCGFQLKIDDPASMKEIIEVVQSTFEKHEESLKDEGSPVAKRMKFLVEMIVDLKNNRKRKFQEDISEQYKQLKQTVKDMQKQEKKTGENTLRIPYSDLIHAETKGRWWLVGSAWVGNQVGSESDLSQASSLASIKSKDFIANALTDMDSKLIQKLEKLAKDQRMTTDLRKAVFYIIMGSDDFLDAFQRLVKLGIQKNNREIARVLLHCCCQEKNYNPYYGKLAEKLCSVEKTGRAFQYTFYEHFDELSKSSIRKIINLSQILSELIGKGCISIAMLKTIDFNSLDQLEIVFFRLLILHLLLDFTELETTRCFLRLAKLDEHEELKESLILFLYQFVKKEFRRGFIYELLSLTDISKKDDKKWLKQQEKLVKSRASLMRKVLRTDLNDLD